MLQIGQVLIGYCGGHFRNDRGKDKTVEAVGKDWVICRDRDGKPLFAWNDDIFDIHEALADYVDQE